MTFGLYCWSSLRQPTAPIQRNERAVFFHVEIMLVWTQLAVLSISLCRSLRKEILCSPLPLPPVLPGALRLWTGVFHQCVLYFRGWSWSVCAAVVWDLKYAPGWDSRVSSCCLCCAYMHVCLNVAWMLSRCSRWLICYNVQVGILNCTYQVSVVQVILFWY